MAKKDNNIEKSYDFGKSEFNRKMKKICQEREAKGYTKRRRCGRLGTLKSFWGMVERWATRRLI